MVSIGYFVCAVVYVYVYSLSVFPVSFRHLLNVIMFYLRTPDTDRVFRPRVHGTKVRTVRLYNQRVFMTPSVRRNYN